MKFQILSPWVVMAIIQVDGKVIVSRRTMYPGGEAVTLDLEFRPIRLICNEQQGAVTVSLVTALPVLVQVYICKMHFYPDLPTIPAQEEGQKEANRSNEMLRHSPTMSMLFDAEGKLIQVSNGSYTVGVRSCLSVPRLSARSFSLLSRPPRLCITASHARRAPPPPPSPPRPKIDCPVPAHPARRPPARPRTTSAPTLTTSWERAPWGGAGARESPDARLATPTSRPTPADAVPRGNSRVVTAGLGEGEEKGETGNGVCQ